MADYDAWPPLWDIATERKVPAGILDRISHELRHELHAWAARWDALSKHDYEWPSAAEAQAWRVKGHGLAKALAIELGTDYEILYWTPEGLIKP